MGLNNIIRDARGLHSCPGWWSLAHIAKLFLPRSLNCRNISTGTTQRRRTAWTVDPVHLASQAVQKRGAMGTLTVQTILWTSVAFKGCKWRRGVLPTQIWWSKSKEHFKGAISY
uniref:Uncharacterized protein n=1 Tax=Pyxicephalus adspersus TaxID=30357 RepID=A0AAV3ACG0_PYXAD|nr:TPA: hypothetical protein GDO54_013109 [Pyxicephalus adspersus]